jgi:hypothetical protein
VSERLTTEVVGFRQWRVNDDLQLRATARNAHVWVPGENRAVCDPLPRTATFGPISLRWDGSYDDPPPPKKCDHAPTPECECGLYALHSPNDLWYGKKNLWQADPLIAGVVCAWGRLEVHHGGFRAEFARVCALAAPESKRDCAVARAVAADYGVPLVDAGTLAQVASEYGVSVPEAMRPEKPAPAEYTVSGSFQYQSLFGGVATLPVYSSGKPNWRQYTPFNIDLGPTEKSDDPVARSPKRRNQYDPRAFLPKRKGGKGK